MPDPTKPNSLPRMRAAVASLDAHVQTAAAKADTVHLLRKAFAIVRAHPERYPTACQAADQAERVLEARL